MWGLTETGVGFDGNHKALKAPKIGSNPGVLSDGLPSLIYSYIFKYTHKGRASRTDPGRSIVPVVCKFPFSLKKAWVNQTQAPIAKGATSIQLTCTSVYSSAIKIATKVDPVLSGLPPDPAPPLGPYEVCQAGGRSRHALTAGGTGSAGCAGRSRALWVPSATMKHIFKYTASARSLRQCGGKDTSPQNLDLKLEIMLSP